MNKLLTLLLTSFSFFISYSQHPSIGGFNVYYGHLHNHYKEPPCRCFAETGYLYGRDSSKLDFLGLSEHDFLTDTAVWDSVKAMADKYNKDHSFITFWGYEWSHSDYGHVTIIGTQQFYPRYFAKTDRFNELINWLTEVNGYAFLNHPGDIDNTLLEFNHFKSVPSERILGIELWNSNQLFSKYYYNDGYYKGDSLSYIDEANIRGWRLGASGSEDNHVGTWGKSNYRLAILAPALTRTDLMNALIKRRFYSTLDKNLALSFQINGNEMGSQISAGTANIRIQAKDLDNEKFTKIRLYKNGKKIDSVMVDTASVDVHFTKNAVCKDYFYVVVVQKDSNEAISSPIWIRDTTNVSPAISLPAQSPCSATSKCITSPPSVYHPKDSLILAADVMNTDSTSIVEFYYDSLLIYSAQKPPYLYRMKIPQIGKIPFTVVAKNQCGTNIKTLTTLNIVLKTSIDIADFDHNQISYSPNPCSEMLQLNLPPLNFEITVINLQGITFTKMISQSREIINMDVSGLIPGVYVILVKSEKNYKTLKFIKQ